MENCMENYDVYSEVLEAVSKFYMLNPKEVAFGLFPSKGHKLALHIRENKMASKGNIVVKKFNMDATYQDENGQIKVEDLTVILRLNKKSQNLSRIVKRHEQIKQNNNEQEQTM